MEKGILEKECPALRDCRLSEGEFTQYNKVGAVKLPQNTLDVLELQSGMELLSIRSSDIAFTMGAKGPLLEKAHNFHGEIERY